MLRFAAFAILFAAACAVPINGEAELGDLGVIVVDSIDEYLAENPNVTLLAQFAKEKIQGRNRFKYTIGRRRGDDDVVANYHQSRRWRKPRDVTAKFIFPAETAVGSVVVTYIVIFVDQSSNTGRAHIISGGIGQRRVTVIIEAPNTLFFKYDAQVYGYD